MRASERVAPLTAGAFYKAFSQDYERDGAKGNAVSTFRRLVTKRMIEDPLLTADAVYIELGRAMHAGGEPWEEVARIGVEMEFRHWADTPSLVLLSAMALHALDGAVKEWTSDVERNELASLVRIYVNLLPLYGRQMRNGITWDHLAAAVSDLVAGMSVFSRFSAETRDVKLMVDVTGTGNPKEWHLCALAAWAIYQGFTEPCPIPPTSGTI
jgi:hypothetical protein